LAAAPPAGLKAAFAVEPVDVDRATGFHRAAPEAAPSSRSKATHFSTCFSRNRLETGVTDATD
jgi:hypothetical protein